ncbi:sterol desaturase family protein [Flavobacteriales bacterium]|nr:sterol desaturase family protein [Flavobacteriales bacterium]
MSTILLVSAIFGAFVLMEGVAWFTHKYVMHGFLWSIHRDHHQHREGFFERNDLFFLVFATPGCSLIVCGIVYSIPALLGGGIGISLYGLCYFLVHDVFIHQRFRLFKSTDSVYFKAIRKAHKVHHKNQGKEDQECFGLLFVSRKYLHQAIKAKRS